jgi:hypothetical protein
MERKKKRIVVFVRLSPLGSSAPPSHRQDIHIVLAAAPPAPRCHARASRVLCTVRDIPVSASDVDLGSMPQLLLWPRTPVNSHVRLPAFITDMLNAIVVSNMQKMSVSVKYEYVMHRSLQSVVLIAGTRLALIASWCNLAKLPAATV